MHFSHSRVKLAKLWSSDELRRLRELAEQGVPLNKIAACLHRSESAVRNKAGMQGISVKGGAHLSCQNLGVSPLQGMIGIAEPPRAKVARQSAQPESDTARAS